MHMVAFEWIFFLSFLGFFGGLFALVPALVIEGLSGGW